MFWRRLAYGSGFVGCAVLIIVILVAAFAYEGHYDEAYSPLSHTISELGEVGVSDQRWVFNIGLMLSGLALGLHMLGTFMLIRQHQEGRVARNWLLTGSGFGVLAGLGAILVGVFPLGNPIVGETGHFIVAGIFFGCMGLAVLLITIGLFMCRRPVLPQWLRYIGAAVIPLYVFFIFFVTDGSLGSFADYPDRAFRWDPFMEWVCLAGAVTWIVATSFGLAFSADKG